MTLQSPTHYLQSTVSLVMQFGMSPLIISADLAPAYNFFLVKRISLSETKISSARRAVE